MLSIITENPKLLTPADVARRLQVHRSTILKWCKAQMIECIVLNPWAQKQRFRFTEELFQKLLKRGFQKVAIPHRSR